MDPVRVRWSDVPWYTPIKVTWLDYSQCKFYHAHEYIILPAAFKAGDQERVGEMLIPYFKLVKAIAEVPLHKQQYLRQGPVLVTLSKQNRGKLFVHDIEPKQ